MIILSWITGSAEVSEATYTFFIVRLSGLLLWLFVLLFFFVCFFLRIIFFVFCFYSLKVSPRRQEDCFLISSPMVLIPSSSHVIR
jgi:predicted membrane protein